MSEEKKLFKVTIDGITIEVEPGTTILNAARQIGGEVTPPAMCYYTKLKNSGGKCRTCLVEVAAGSAADPRPMPKLVASCRTTVMDGMVVKNTTSDRVLDAREGVVEFLLINHPIDCPICDQAGECDLQDLSYVHGADASRFDFQKRTFVKHNLGPYIQLHMTRCIMCYRCVYVADQVTNKRVHGILERGDKAEIATYIEKALDNDFIGNVIDVCPVGALTDRTFRFKSRVWFTKPVKAHRNCSKCCGKVHAWFRGDEILRVTGRKDQWGEVEDWICNECRFEKKRIHDWVIEGPAEINRHSVISQGHYSGKVGTTKPNEAFSKVMKGRQPNLLMDIHTVSEVNPPELDLSALPGPAHSTDFPKKKGAGEESLTISDKGKGSPGQ